MEYSLSTPVSSTRILNASMLIAGTCIGGGMLALPISSSPIGFFPAILVMLVCSIFMTLTGLLYLEATLWMKKNSHLDTLSIELLSKSWRVICTVTYIFVCYASIVAYMSGGGKQLTFVINEVFKTSLESWQGIFLFSSIFGTVFLLNKFIIEKVNTILFVSMILSYVMLIAYSGNALETNLVLRQNWNGHLFYAFPLMLTTFSFPGIVPTISPYLNSDPKSIRLAIVSGTTITFIVYFIWLLIIFGSIPHSGPFGLIEAFTKDIPITECLHYALNNPHISVAAQFFAFFAITTSFLGISLSLFDFLTDSLKHRVKKNWDQLFFYSIIFGPCLIFSIYFERAFISALEISGGVGDAILSGIIPVIMIWQGRYIQKRQRNYQVWGGKPLLIILLVFSCSILSCELIRRIF